MDLSKFFDRVQHDVLIERVSRKVHDKRLLRLIGRYLRAGVMVEGVLQPTDEGTMQGGPLVTLLANILLDDFDKELERRGCALSDTPTTSWSSCEASGVPTRVRVGGAIPDAETETGGQPAEEQRATGPDGVEFLGFVFVGKRVTIKSHRRS